MTPTPSSYHVVLLVGFMGSGKSTVGSRLAALLGWDFLDLDDLVEERTGLSVEAMFRERGEDAFRRVEAEVAEDALRGRNRVVAPGGGWAVRPGRLESVGPDVLTVWLEVEAETAVRRARLDGRARPLLDVPDPVGRARELLERRRPSYRRARLHLDAEHATPERLARNIVQYLETVGETA
ncbi:MAG: shikimate kinase [Gemmatimonadota bacterium]|jgi:shikimate kinase